jgi:hypothetical protein
MTTTATQANLRRSKQGGIMPIVVVFDFPGEDIAKYHQVFKLGGPAVNAQPSRFDHICYRTDSGFTVIDVWEDEASFSAFGSVIGPALAGAGLDPKPTIHPLEATMGKDGKHVVY